MEFCVKQIKFAWQDMRIVMVLLCAALLLLGAPGESYAAESSGSNNPPSVFNGNQCTNAQIFSTQAAKLIPTLQAVIVLIDTAVQKAMRDLYKGIVESNGYASAVSAAVVLYLMFYGIAFIFGIVPLTMSQAVMRFIKIAVVLSLLTPQGWDWYEATVVRLFRDGGDDLTAKVAALTPKTSSWLDIDLGPVNLSFGSGGFSGAVTTGVSAPIQVFQGVVKVALSPRMFILTFAAFGSGPYGLPMGLAMMWAIFQILAMLLRAMEVFGLAIVVRAILLGLGPIFITFMLFERTKPLFEGWYRQLISFSLQPVFMFAFLAFYLGILESAVWDMVPDTIHAVQNTAAGTLSLPVEACWNKGATTQGGQYDNWSWRYNLAGWMPWQGQYNFKGPIGAVGQLGQEAGLLPLFPVTIISTLITLLLAYIGQQLINTSAQLAADIAGGGINLANSASSSQEIGSSAESFAKGNLNLKKHMSPGRK